MYPKSLCFQLFLPCIKKQHSRCSFFPLTIQIKKFGLELLKGTQFFNGYDKNVNAQVTNAFSVAAYRFGHSLVQEWFKRFSQIGFEHKRTECGLKTEFRPIPVLDFNNPQYLYETDQGGVDAIVRGLVKDSAAKSDGWVNRNCVVPEELVLVNQVL